MIIDCSSRCEGSLNLFKQLCDSSGNLAFATNWRLVLKSSPNRFEHRERNLVLQASSWLSHFCPNDSRMVFLGMPCIPLFSDVLLWFSRGFPMYSIVFLCMFMFICGYCWCFVSVYLCELADVMRKGTSVEGGYFSLRHRIQVLSAARGRKTESAFQMLL